MSWCPQIKYCYSRQKYRNINCFFIETFLKKWLITYKTIATSLWVLCDLWSLTFLLYGKLFFVLSTKGTAFLQQKSRSGKDSNIFKYFSVFRWLTHFLLIINLKIILMNCNWRIKMKIIVKPFVSIAWAIYIATYHLRYFMRQFVLKF